MTTTTVTAEKAALYQTLAVGAVTELQRLERVSGLTDSVTAAATCADAVRIQSAEAAHRAAAADAALSSHEATFAKIPAYVEKLRQIRANLVVLAHNAQKVRFLATEVARECDVPIADALAAARLQGSSRQSLADESHSAGAHEAATTASAAEASASVSADAAASANSDA